MKAEHNHNTPRGTTMIPIGPLCSPKEVAELMKDLAGRGYTDAQKRLQGHMLGPDGTTSEWEKSVYARTGGTPMYIIIGGKQEDTWLSTRHPPVMGKAMTYQEYMRDTGYNDE